MNVISRRRLQEFWTRHPQAEGPLKAWRALVSAAQWTGPQDVRTMFSSADFLADNRVVFDIGGNKFRVIVRVSYPFKNLMVRFVGAHAEYDRVDAETV